jgi:formate dehydrogenase subunit delta
MVSKCTPTRSAFFKKQPPKKCPLMSHEASPDKLVYMANQIGKFFASQGPESAVTGTAEHIKKFWDPRMLAAIFAHLDNGGAGLDPAVRQAVERLKSAS